MEKLVKTLTEFKNHGLKDPEADDMATELNLAEDIIDDLVDAVGSEEEVEAAAEEAYNDLKNAYESEEIEMMEKEGVPENLAMSALIVKLVEKGKLDPKKADKFIGDNSDD